MTSNVANQATTFCLADGTTTFLNSTLTDPRLKGSVFAEKRPSQQFFNCNIQLFNKYIDPFIRHGITPSWKDFSSEFKRKEVIKVALEVFKLRSFVDSIKESKHKLKVIIISRDPPVRGISRKEFETSLVVDDRIQTEELIEQYLKEKNLENTIHLSRMVFVRVSSPSQDVSTPLVTGRRLKEQQFGEKNYIKAYFEINVSFSAPKRNAKWKDTVRLELEDCTDEKVFVLSRGIKNYYQSEPEKLLKFTWGALKPNPTEPLSRFLNTSRDEKVELEYLGF